MVTSLATRGASFGPYEQPATQVRRYPEARERFPKASTPATTASIRNQAGLHGPGIHADRLGFVPRTAQSAAGVARWSFVVVPSERAGIGVPHAREAVSSGR